MLRKMYLGLGWLFVALAMAGIVLPLLPATPFALLAAACFNRSSPDAYRRLLQSRILGTLLQEWQSDRGFSLKSKCILLGMAFCSLSTTLVVCSHHRLSWMLSLGAAVLVTITIALLPAKQAATVCKSQVSA